MFSDCAECAKKHLRAALAYATDGAPDPVPVCVNSVTALVSEAWVLLAESGSYPEHVDLALGFLVRAEDDAFAGGLWETTGDRVRKIRLASKDPVELMGNLEAAGLVNPMVGHLREAAREGRIELPSVVSSETVKRDFDGLIKAEGIITPTTPGKRKEGDEVMACAKKAACKGGSCKKSAKKAACKGVKSKKGCCK